MLTIQELIFLTDTQRNHQTQKPWVARKAQQQHVLLLGKTPFLDVGGFCIPSTAIILKFPVQSQK